MDDQFFLSNFNTSLSPEEEEAYNRWLLDVLRTQGRDLSQDHADYDLRGYWKENPGILGAGHGPDTYKKPNHPTFSNESIYHNTPNQFGGNWIGGAWGKDPWGGDTFSPSKEMVNTTHKGTFLPDYFQRFEKKAQLVMP